MAHRRRSRSKALGASSVHHKHESASAIRRATTSYRKAYVELTKDHGSCEVAFDALVDGVASESVARAEYSGIDRAEREHEYLRVPDADRDAFTRPFELFRTFCVKKGKLPGTGR